MSEFNWDAIITEVEDNLCKWEDLSPKMQTMLLFYYDSNHPYARKGITTNRTLNALERRGLMESGTDWSWGKSIGKPLLGRCYIELTGAGRRLVARYLDTQKVVQP